ncbi:AI-2E family transporter [Nitratireductor sp. ZSWI3]|uniref:AI-2E family transporter n=1 Tax=Nitratireductor sp. ZSWI3 TaxID=2966359 RepID=UPI0021506156|nr:AI-2E family transporter [Nitratireductor sp. ZSWI3]MCR4267768.1 AI-2E family transporter [Nitratireductor sp. ZSWI3]
MPKVTLKDAETEVESGAVAAGSSGRPLGRQLLFWGLALGGLILFLYVFSSILLPFLAGLVLAYFLDPVADRLERLGLSRTAATVVILIAFLVMLTLAFVIVVPVLGKQLADFASRLPDYLARLQALLLELEPAWFDNLLNGETQAARDNLSSILAQGTGFLATLFKSVWSSGMALVNLASLFVVTPVVAFYMLLDWDRMVEKVDSWVPRDHVETVRQIARDINVATAGFVRGQGTLCLVLGVFYAVGLSLVGLNFGLLIGLFAGLISFIPYVGSLVGFGLSIGIAVVQFWPEWWWVLVVAGIFFSGQFLEGNILQPKLVGKSVGLHPVWLMFALFAFGYLFGFVGLLIAVPAAAAVAVLVRFALGRYLASPLYAGHEAGADAPGRAPGD